MFARQKPKFKKTLVVSISLFVMVPLIFGAAYFVYGAYEQSLKQANRVVAGQAQTEVVDISNKLSEITYRLLGLANDRVLGEVAVNILYSQFATNKLQEIVENSPYIKAAFIADNSEFIVEGHPLSALTVNPKSLSQTTNQILNFDETDIILRSVIEHSENLYRINPPQNELPNLMLAVPLKKAQKSLITPYKTTAVLYIILQVNELFQNSLNSDSSIPQKKEVFVNGQLIHSTKSNDFSESISAQANMKASLLTKASALDLTVIVSHDKNYHLVNVKHSLILTSVFIVVIFAVLILLLMKYASRITQPLMKVRDLSQRFASGDYSTSNYQASFHELEELVENMNSMANTISQQLVSLEKEKQRAESSERVKAEFLANMSHEIRTPLNGVIGLIDMAGKTSVEPEVIKALDNARNSAKLLLVIVNDILDFSKLEQGEVVIEAIPFSLEDLLKTIHQTLNTTAVEKGIELKVNNKLNDNHWYGDPTRLSQILFNLVTNAIKFTEKGSVTIEVFSQQENIHFEISDTGIGIPESKLDSLFESFKQADVSTTRKYGGTGLGLTISKRLAEIMKGDIKVASKESHGSTFTLMLPLEKQSNLTAKAADVDDVFIGEGLNVLVAEDNKVNQTILLHLLKPTGCNITLVENGQQVLDSVRHIEPDIVLMDVQMPVMDGLSATIKLRNEGFVNPIIMQTANVMEEEVNLYKKSGATDHIAKPLVAAELYEKLTLAKELLVPSIMRKEGS